MFGKRWAATALVTLVSFGPQLRAQVIGQVLAGGAPLGDATVELWSKDQVLARRVTDASGHFRFQALEDRARAILVRRIGFTPNRIDIHPGEFELQVTLVPIPHVLDPVAVTASKPLCPNRENPKARELWSRSTALYLSAAADTLGRWTFMTGLSGVTTAAEMGMLDSARMWRGDRWRNRDALRRERVFIPAHGFAWPLANHIREDYGMWEYPQLDSDHADIFGDPLFGDRHQLSFLESDPDQNTIVYCPLDRKAAALIGSMLISTTAGLISANWTYFNPARNAELAGGEVMFVPPAPTGEPTLPLLAASGWFWRKLRSGAFWRRWQSYDQWKFFLGDSPQ
jgi:hypothetical protein